MQQLREPPRKLFYVLYCASRVASERLGCRWNITVVVVVMNAACTTQACFLQEREGKGGLVVRIEMEFVKLELVGILVSRESGVEPFRAVRAETSSRTIVADGKRVLH